MVTNYQSLAYLLRCQRSDSLAIAIHSDTEKTWGGWRRRVDTWRRTIRSQPGNLWALYHENSFEFSAILFALWAEQRVACIPGSNHERVIDDLNSHVDGFIGEFFEGSPKKVLILDPEQSAEKELLPPVTLDSNQLVVEIYTSGSSGEPQRIPKQLFQLANEVDNLHQLWSQFGDASLFISTVSHHHIYGLLFKILWPLAAGYCFDSQLCEYLIDIPQRIKPNQRFILISSPTHLSRIPDKHLWHQLSSQCKAIFSSGAPLSLAASLDTQSKLHTAPIEVLGSSETGGIAVRQQGPNSDSYWQPFPKIQVSLNEETDCLNIRSPYLAKLTPNEWHPTTDRVKFVGNDRFELLGRIDNIVKIEGIRISLSEMENRLITHKWIKEIKLVVLKNTRTELGAVAVLTGVGKDQLRELGKRNLTIALRSYLLNQFARTVIPRRWRFPKTLPFNKEGKLTATALSAFFTKSNDPLPSDSELWNTPKSDQTQDNTL